MHRFTLPSRIGAVSLVALFSACTVGPDYRPPKPVLPEHWVEQSGNVPGPARQDWVEWWRGFHDAKLNSLVEHALAGNLDLQAADTRISAARAQQTATDAERWPSINASSAYQRQRISPNALLGALGSVQGGSKSGQSGGLLSTLGPIGTPFNLFQAGFDSAWELDLFGGIRRKVESAAANSEAIEENRRDIQVSLSAEVARNYLELTALQAQLLIAQDRLKNQRELDRLVENAYWEGMATSLDAQRTKSELQGVEGAIPSIEARIKNTRHALALLLGLTPGALERELANPSDAIPSPPGIQIGMPSDLLRRRPDIRQAERTAASASASIGAAVAELFPKISLTGAAGFQSQDLSNFTSLSSGFYGFGPRVSLPIFQAGRLLANVDAQEARFKEALAAYDKTVLNALREVEDNLASIKGEHSRKKAHESAERSSRQAAEAAMALYTEGETDLQTVLDTRRAWHDARDRLTQSQLAWSTAHVALYKSLGGGWEAEKPEETRE